MRTQTVLCVKQSPLVENTLDEGNLKNYRIAVIEGDGIGREVVPEGIRVLEAAARRFDLSFTWQHFNWSCETYLKTGRMMPEDGLEQLRPFDALYLGAVGYPGVPDHISLWGATVNILLESAANRNQQAASTREMGEVIAAEVAAVAAVR